MHELDVAVAMLPSGAARSSFQMLLHNGRDQVAAIVSAQSWEGFEYPFPTYFFNCAKTWNGLIVDVGANTGFYTLLGACASCNNLIIPFEPDHLIIDSLRENVALSGIKDQVYPSTLALSSRSGKAALYVPTQEHGLIETSSSLEAEFKSTHSDVRDVAVDTLDSFLSKSEFAEKPVSLIKIDVEGHECHVLIGAKATIRAWRPIIFIEVLNDRVTQFLTEFTLLNHYMDIPLSPNGISVNAGEVKFIPDAWNHAFVPSERVELFLGLGVRRPTL